MPAYEILTAELGPCWVAADSLDEALSLTGEWATGYSATGRSASFSSGCSVCGEHPNGHDLDTYDHPFEPKEERCIYILNKTPGPYLNIEAVHAIREVTGWGLKEARNAYLRADAGWAPVPLLVGVSADQAEAKLTSRGFSVSRTPTPSRSGTTE